MTLFDALWDEINDPHGGRMAAAHHRATTAGGHAILGAMAANHGIWWAGFAVAITYWLAKEAGDLRRGGAWLDGLEDMACVWLGTFYGPWWWPHMIAGCMAYVMAAAAVRAR